MLHAVFPPLSGAQRRVPREISVPMMKVMLCCARIAFRQPPGVRHGRSVRTLVGGDAWRKALMAESEHLQSADYVLSLIHI
eukprot:1038253-Alexandrium_andersonii.AAC.1